MRSARLSLKPEFPEFRFPKTSALWGKAEVVIPPSDRQLGAIERTRYRGIGLCCQIGGGMLGDLVGVTSG